MAGSETVVGDVIIRDAPYLFSPLPARVTLKSFEIPDRRGSDMKSYQANGIPSGPFDASE